MRSKPHQLIPLKKPCVCDCKAAMAIGMFLGGPCCASCYRRDLNLYRQADRYTKIARNSGGNHSSDYLEKYLEIFDAVSRGGMRLRNFNHA
jgi:hypothetical protein